MTKVFLSYARGDDFDPGNPDTVLDPNRFEPEKSFITLLAKDLQKVGFEVCGPGSTAPTST